MVQSIRDQYSEDDVVLWLVNPDDSLVAAYNFVGALGMRLPVLLDSGGQNYQAYPRDSADSFGPFPVHVVVDQDGIIRYLRFQSDLPALKEQVDALLSSER